MAFEFYQKLKELIPIPHKFFQRIEDQVVLSNQLFEYRINPNTKPDEDITHAQNKTTDQYPLQL